MSKLSSLTNKLTGSDNGGKGLFNLSIPGCSLGGLIPVTKETEVHSLGDLLESVTDTIGNLNTIAHMAYCLGEVANEKSMLRILDNITNSILAVAYEMAMRIASVMGAQILGMFGTVAGTILNLVNAIFDFLTSVVKLYETLMAIWDNIRHRALGNWDDFMSQSDCEYMFASIAACIINKLFGDKLRKFEMEVTQKITETGQKWNSAIASELADTNNLANFVRHESFMVNKANDQLRLFA